MRQKSRCLVDKVPVKEAAKAVAPMARAEEEMEKVVVAMVTEEEEMAAVGLVAVAKSEVAKKVWRGQWHGLRKHILRHSHRHQPESG
jgi:hypothetical protein